MGTIRSKIIVNVVIALLTVVGIVGVEYKSMSDLGRLQDEAGKRAADTVVVAGAAALGDRMYGVIADAVINRDLNATAKEWAEVKKEALDDIANVEKLADTPAEKDQAAAGRKATMAIIDLFENKLTPVLKNDANNSSWKEIQELDGEIDKQKEILRTNMELINKSLIVEMKKADEEFDKERKAAVIEALVIGLVGVMVLAILAVWLLRAIMKPVEALRLMLMDISQGEGDLTRRLDDSTKDEFADVGRYFNLFIEKLRGMVNQIASTANQVAAASIQLHSTSERIATGAEEVASQTSTVATASEEMSATSGDIAQNCQMAAEGAQRASHSASNGGMVVERTVNVMEQIAVKVKDVAKTVESLGARSDQIGAIIGTIEDIADQTNLLALNAAIEAARAGEQGRGFAVVADEVRALAERTTRATREIGEMIKAIQNETRGAVAAMEQGVNQVETGTEEAQKSGQALQEILDQVNDVAMQINQVATAAEEQTATTSEISSNILQITEVVQQTSRGAHESATAAARLNSNADELLRLVRQFKL